MRNVFLVIISLCFVQNAYTQIIFPSYCNAPDSIKTLYADDAAKLAIRWIYNNKLAYNDSVKIPDSLLQIFSNALLAVYNTKNLPARDTVILQLNLHVFCTFNLHEVRVTADSNATWMKKLRIGEIPTGYLFLDSIIQALDLTLKDYWSPKHWKEDRALFHSKTPYNMLALSNIMDKLDSVDHAAPNSCIGDGDDITASITPTYTELIYNYGWGDCPAGCIYNRFWKFRVYKDCSVEFVESYGDKMKNTGLTESDFPNISLYPNPFQNAININGLQAQFQYSISNILGQIIKTGNADSSTINGLENLEKGIYILQIRSNEKTGSFKLLKN